MPIDPSIALSFKQGPGPLEMMGNAQSLANLVAQGEQNKLKVQEYQEGRARERSLRDLLAGGADEEKLLRGGFLKESQDLGKARREAEKSQADIAKAKSETMKNEIAAAKERINFSGQAFGYVRQNPTLQNALGVIQSLATKQMISPEEAQQYTQMVQSNPTPENIKALADQAFQSTLAAKDQIEKFETRNLGGTTETIATNPVTGQTRVVNVAKNTQSPDSVASNATQRRGQDLLDQRARDQLAAGQTVYDTERGVLVNKATGQATPATASGKPLGAKEKPMTDAQAKANLFGTRMKEANRILNDVEGLYFPSAVNAKMAAADMPLIGGAAGMAGNFMLSEQGQQAEQAMRDFINAVLRRESGAVISPAEFANAQKQYFPQEGDTKEVLNQKRRNRELAISGLEVEVPGGFKQSPTLTNPKAGQSQWRVVK